METFIQVAHGVAFLWLIGLTVCHWIDFMVQRKINRLMIGFIDDQNDQILALGRRVRNLESERK